MSEAVNHGLPDFYRYVRDRQQRRQEQVAAADVLARETAPDPIAREHAGRAATRSAVAAFDANERELTFDEWKQAAA
jgi:hypothetical protein